MSKVLLTGSTGFIGTELLKQLKLKNYFIHTSSRSSLEKNIDKVKNFKINQIDKNSNWSEALNNVNCVIHCAGIAVENNKLNANDLNYYNRINVEGTSNLAYQAAVKGVRRFIFLSSIKVNGERTNVSSNFKNTDVPKPEDIYAISKWRAEQSLHEISKQTGLEIVIIRAPMVYGEGVKGNFLRLLNLIYQGVPLPFGSVNNLRSFISLENLVDLIICCINHPKATGQTFLVSDGEDISTPNLIKKIAMTMKKKAVLIPVPISIIKLIGKIIRKKKKIDSLINSLQIDIFFTKETLQWEPQINLDKGLNKTAEWYLLRNRNG